MTTENEMAIFQQSTDIEAIEAGQRAEYDIQITTAKRYPRNLARVKDNCLAIVTMDKETAGACRYTLPRGGKTLSGPSVHLARIIAQQYGNIRVDARVKQITDKQIISEAVAFDLETNYAVKMEVRRSITDKSGKRFNDDMITVTGNAANAISFRNAVLAVIPKGLTDICYNAALRQITGDLTSEDKIIAARTKAVEYFTSTYNVTVEQVLKAINLRSVNQIKEEQIADLRGIIQAIKDGDTTPEEVFQLFTPGPDLKKPELKIGTPAFDRAKKAIQGGKSLDDVKLQFEVSDGVAEALLFNSVGSVDDGKTPIDPKQENTGTAAPSESEQGNTGIPADVQAAINTSTADVAPAKEKKPPKGREWVKPDEGESK